MIAQEVASPNDEIDPRILYHCDPLERGRSSGTGEITVSERHLLIIHSRQAASAMLQYQDEIREKQSAMTLKRLFFHGASVFYALSFGFRYCFKAEIEIKCNKVVRVQRRQEGKL